MTALKARKENLKLNHVLAALHWDRQLAHSITSANIMYLKVVFTYCSGGETNTKLICPPHYLVLIWPLFNMQTMSKLLQQLCRLVTIYPVKNQCFTLLTIHMVKYVYENCRLLICWTCFRIFVRVNYLPAFCVR